MSIFFKTLGWASAAFFWFISAGMIMTGAWVSGVVIGVLTLLFVPNISAKIAGLGRDKLKEKQGFGGHAFRFNAHYKVWFLALVIVISAFLFLAEDRSSADEGSFANDHIKTYSVLKVDDESFSDRKIISYFIVADEPMTSTEDYAFTARKAAQDFVEKTGADVVAVYLEPDESVLNRGLALAIVRYYADGKGYSGALKKGPVWNTLAAKNPPSEGELDFWREYMKFVAAGKAVSGKAEKKFKADLGLPSDYQIWFSKRAAFHFKDLE